MNLILFAPCRQSIKSPLKSHSHEIVTRKVQFLISKCFCYFCKGNLNFQKNSWNCRCKSLKLNVYDLGENKFIIYSHPKYVRDRKNEFSSQNKPWFVSDALFRTNFGLFWHTKIHFAAQEVIFTIICDKLVFTQVVNVRFLCI